MRQVVPRARSWRHHLHVEDEPGRRCSRRPGHRGRRAERACRRMSPDGNPNPARRQRGGVEGRVGPGRDELRSVSSARRFLPEPKSPGSEASWTAWDAAPVKSHSTVDPCEVCTLLGLNPASPPCRAILARGKGCQSGIHPSIGQTSVWSVPSAFIRVDRGGPGPFAPEGDPRPVGRPLGSRIERRVIRQLDLVRPIRVHRADVRAAPVPLSVPLAFVRRREGGGRLA